VLNNAIGPTVITIRLGLTRHNLYGIDSEGIGVYLPNRINIEPGLVEALEPVAFRQLIYP
jgi:hypothetical protein